MADFWLELSTFYFFGIVLVLYFTALQIIKDTFYINRGSIPLITLFFALVGAINFCWFRVLLG